MKDSNRFSQLPACDDANRECPLFAAACALVALAGMTPSALASSVVSSTQGPGGNIPDAPFQQESNSWNIVPYWPDLVSPVHVPMRIDHVTSVVLRGLEHTWRGDLHVYLENPAGQRFNVVVRPGFVLAGFGDPGKCVYGLYTIVESGGASLAQGNADIEGGTYNQYLNSGNGQWTSAAYPIANKPLSEISGDAGVWKLHVRDWFPSANGSIFNWRLYGTNDSAITSFCFGDATNVVTPCPCAPGALGGGCANSSGSGATLIATGSASIAANDLVLLCMGMLRASASIFRQATGVSNDGFGLLSPSIDGIDCLDGSTVRVGRRGTIGSAAAVRDLAESGAIPASGGTRYYQVTYRNAASFCTPAAWNSSNALRVVWAP